MERYKLRWYRGLRPGFDRLPNEHRRRVFGVDYAWVRGMQGGELFFTRHGWAIAEAVLPEFWFDEGRYRKIGRALPGATGAVYHVPVAHPRRSNFGLVVKFCRCAQDVGLTLAEPEARFGWPTSLLDSAEFSDPFTEFGHLWRLRASGRVRTMHPLAIYCPAAHYPAWQLGRDAAKQSGIARAMARDQSNVTDCPRATWEPERVYVLVYQWINGVDLEQAWKHAGVPRESMVGFTHAVADLLVELGFAVLDHKPRHIILRRQPSNSTWLRRGSDWAWALVDYELLTPLPASVAASS